MRSCKCGIFPGGHKHWLYSNGEVIRDIEHDTWLLQLQDLGAGEILVDDVSRDGTMRGADLPLAKSIARKLDIPVVFAGGVKSPDDVAELIERTEVSGVGVSSIFHFTNYTPSDCRDSLKLRGLPAR